MLWHAVGDSARHVGIEEPIVVGWLTHGGAALTATSD